MKTILGLKLGRRLMAAAALKDEEFVFGDQRYVTSRPASFESSMAGYFQRLLDQIRPTSVYYYAPTGEGTATARLVSLLERVAATQGIPARRLTKSDLLDNLGFTPVRTRGELRELLRPFWALLQEGSFVRQAVLAEAAAAALVGEVEYHQSSG